MESNITIVQINNSNIAALQQIGRQTFAETFAESNTAENMAKYLEEAYAYEKLSAEVNDANSVFYFAMMEDKEIGYLKLNFGEILQSKQYKILPFSELALNSASDIMFDNV